MSRSSRLVLAGAREQALRLWRVNVPEPGHLLLALLENSSVRRVLQEEEGAGRIGSEVERVVAGERPTMLDLRGAIPVDLAGPLAVSPRLNDLLERAAVEADTAGDPEIEPVHLLLALLAQESGSAAELLRERGITREMLME